MNKIESKKINIKKIKAIINENKINIVFFILCTFLLAFYLTSLVPIKYETVAILKINEKNDTSSISGLGGLGNLSSLAGMAGINIGDKDQTDFILKLMVQPDFIYSVLNEDEIIDLFTIKHWDVDNDLVVRNENIYDFENKRWRRSVKKPLNPEPNKVEVLNELLKYLSFYKDTKSGTITIKMNFFYNKFSENILRKLVSEVNNYRRQLDDKESSTVIFYIESQLEAIKNESQREMLFEMKERELQKQVFSRTIDDYVFKFIQKPITNLQVSITNKVVLFVFLITLLNLPIIVYVFKNAKNYSLAEI